jgi:hypothetical protein
MQMLRVGALASHNADRELYLVKGKAIAKALTADRVKLMRWSNGSIKTADASEVEILSFPESHARLCNAAQQWNRRMHTLNGSYYLRRSELLDELKGCIANSDKYERHYVHVEPGGAHIYRQDFVREFLAWYAWLQDYKDPFLTNDHVVRKVRRYCEYVGVLPPRKSLIQRRLAVFWGSTNSI